MQVYACIPVARIVAAATHEIIQSGAAAAAEDVLSPAHVVVDDGSRGLVVIVAEAAARAAARQLLDGGQTGPARPGRVVRIAHVQSALKCTRQRFGIRYAGRIR